MERVEIEGAELLKFRVGASAFLVNPSEGARLINWNISMADGAVRDVIYWPEDAPVTGGDFTTTHGGMFAMFPFCGRSFVDGRDGFWKTPDGKVLPMQMHGYARDGKFETSFVSDTDLRLRFVPSPECEAAFPYKYEFFVNYRFREFSMICELVLENKGRERIPWAAGLHPFFSLPWSEGTSRRNYRMLCDAKKAFYILENGTFAPADTDKLCFEDPEMHNKISVALKTGIVKFGPKNGEEDITLKINSGAKPDASVSVVTWSENTDSPYYCVEPWMSPPNSASTAKHFVDGGSTRSFSAEIDLL